MQTCDAETMFFHGVSERTGPGLLLHGIRPSDGSAPMALWAGLFFRDGLIKLGSDIRYFLFM